MLKTKYHKRLALFLSILMVLSVFTSYIPVSAHTVDAIKSPLPNEDDAVPIAQTGSAERHIRLVYDRTDANYDNWDVWVWGTGIQDDNIDFTRFENGKAIAEIAVAEDASRVGFIVRQEGWADREPNGIEMDRHIDVNQLDLITKVHVRSGQEEIHVVPEMIEPTASQGHATFYFRDKELYLTDQMSSIEKAELSINGQRFEMVFEEANERFVYTYKDIPFGDYEYKFFVTREGIEEEVDCQYFSGLFSFKKPQVVNIVSTVTPQAITYNENAVLTLNVITEENAELEFSEIYVDLSAIGGPERLAIDPELKAITLSVHHATTAGLKKLPIRAIDSSGNTYDSEAEITIQARTFTGKDDFDWDEAIIYFLLTDRFFNGDESNDDPYGIGYDKNDPGAYQGGDFKGITEKLDYLYDLGINTIWINPIVENIAYDVRWNDDPHITPYYGYHGYWASNFSELNPHFGTMEDFHEMIDQAHARGMKIMIDVVLNHTGYGLKASDSVHDGKIPHFPTQEDRARFEGMLRQGGTDTVRGELAGLPDFITEDPQVRAQVIEWQSQWIEKSRTPKGNTIDYFRVDTVKHVEDATWMAFKNALTEEMPEFKMIGESWGASQSNDHDYLRTGMMDSLLDFNFKNIARNFVDGQIHSVASYLEERNEKIDNTAMFGQFISSHDEPRFLTYIGEEDNIGKHMLAASLMITAKGQPVIYYGDELALTGRDNYPYYENRQNMPWDEVKDNEVLAHYKALLAFRNEYSQVIAKGDRLTLAGSNAEKYHFFKRSYKDQSVYIGLNVHEEAKNVTLSVSSDEVLVKDNYSGEIYEAENGQVTFTIPAMAEGGTLLLTAQNGEILGLDRNPDIEDEIPENHLRVHYKRDDQKYDGLGLWVWGDVLTWSESVAGWPQGATKASGRSEYGVYFDIELRNDAQNIHFLVNNSQGDNLTGDLSLEYFSNQIREVWIKEGSSQVFLWEPLELADNTVRIYYEREDGDYDGFKAWIWGDVANPSSDWPHGEAQSGLGKHGAYFDIELKENAQEMGFLFVRAGEQTDDYRFVMLDRYDHIFTKHGDMLAYTNPFGAIPIVLVSAELLSDERIELRFSKTEDLNVEDLLEKLVVKNSDGELVSISQAEIKNSRAVEIYGDFNLEKVPYTIQYEETSVIARSSWRKIDEMYAYHGKLGAELHEDGTATLKLWSPKAQEVSIILYDKDNQHDLVKDRIDLTLGDRGVWSVHLDQANTGLESLRGYYYHYRILHQGEDEPVLALDPYAKSMAAWANPERGGKYSIGKAAIVPNPSDIGPKLDFAHIPGFEKREDAIIYEVHIRDFTSDKAISDELTAQFGTFAAFVERLDYIQDMGVTHIEILPVMSYFWGDEWASNERLWEYSSSGNNYNWGYDPHSYFSLTGMYSENPDDPEKRIKEFKMLIDEIHKREMGVILDVVYNHTARVDIFEDLVRHYYHFMDADGTPRTSFGGGRLGTTHAMSRRILVDSILYWTEEYKIDGFRFDMMGDHDAESIQIAFDKAQKINPNIIMVGEGWRTFVGDELVSDVMSADQDWMQHTEAVGSFSDEFRNELKSGFGSEGQPRFITNGARNVNQIFDNIKAQPHNFVADQPGDVVPYIEKHDNLTLYDVIAQSIKKDPELPENNEEIHKRIRIGNAMVLTSQGTAFIHAGQEFGRTKQFRHPDYRYEEGKELPEAPYKSTFMVDQEGKPFTFPFFIHDSYDSSDIINKFDWTMATDAENFPINHVTSEYTKGLIQLRRSTDAFRLGSKELVDQNVTRVNAPEIQEEDLVIAYRNEASNGDAYYVFVNADMKARTFTIGKDLRNGVILVDANEAGIESVKNPNGFTLTSDAVILDPLTTLVIKLAHDEKASPTPIPKPEPEPEPAPAPAPTEPGEEEGEETAKPLERVEVKAEDVIKALKDETTERVEVKVSSESRLASVTLPSVAFRQNRANPIPVVIGNGRVSVTIPGNALELEEGQDVLFEMEELEEEGAASSEFRFSLTDAQTGKSIKFKHPVIITVPYHSENVSNTNRLGIYRFNPETEEWDYVGGRVDPETGEITVALRSFSRYRILENTASFADFTADHWAYGEMDILIGRHIFKGTPNNLMEANRNATRAEFFTLLVRTLGLTADEETLDFVTERWYADYANIAIAHGIIDGSDVRGSDFITREEMANMVFKTLRAVEYQHVGEGPAPVIEYSDLELLDPLIQEHVESLTVLGIFKGEDGAFKPFDASTRAQTGAVIFRLLILLGEI